jgi:hypothetical protein
MEKIVVWMAGVVEMTAGSTRFRFVAQVFFASELYFRRRG